jgi:hypothetical protein
LGGVCRASRPFARADDWPPWLGPDRNAISRETNVDIYGVDNTGTDCQGTGSKKSLLKCLDLRIGELKWTKEA